MSRSLIALVLVAAVAACTPSAPATPAAAPRASGTAGPGSPAGALQVTASPPVARADTPASVDRTVPPPSELNVDCTAITEDSPYWVPCNVMDGFRSRNLSALHGFMTDPFLMAMWRSEGRKLAPEETTAEIQASYLPDDPSRPPDFTTERAYFPALDGTTVDALLGPEEDVSLVVYGMGFGADGGGEALLYFGPDATGELRWRGMVYAPIGFR